MPRQGGYTKAELLVVLAVIVALTAIVFAILGRQRRQAVDAHRLQEIHKAFVVFATQNQDRYPIPGQIWRYPTDLIGDGSKKWIPTSAQEDLSRNTTANLYSCIIAQEYVPLDISISPRERNANVKRIASYDYAAYNPRK